MFIISSPVAHLMALFRSQVQPVTLAPAHLALTAGPPLTRPVDNTPEVCPYRKAPAGRVQEVVRCFNDASPIADVKLSYRRDPPLLSCSCRRAIPSAKLKRPRNIPDQVKSPPHVVLPGGVMKDKSVE